MTPELSIVVPVYNNWWLTRRCLRALDALRQKSVRFEVLVVDNASSDETPHEAHAFDIRYLRQETNRNFAGACNIGAEHARAPVVLFLNNDAAPIDDPHPALMRAFDDPTVVIAGGKLLFEDGVVQSAGMALLENAHWWLSHRNLPESTTEDTGEAIEMPAVSGAAMAVRRDWFVSRGGFDETFLNGFEDVDLCMRALREGMRTVYVAQSRFEHFESASAGRFDFEAQNERRFYDRWARLLQALPRTRRISAGTMVIRGEPSSDPLTRAAREDLLAGLRAIGHPVFDGGVPLAHRIDEKYYRRCAIEWFGKPTGIGHAVRIGNEAGKTQIAVRGMLACTAPWLPGVNAERATALKPARERTGRVATLSDRDAQRVAAAGYTPVLFSPNRLLDGPGDVTVDAVYLCEDTDPARYGNVLVALSGVPVVTRTGSAMAQLFTHDVLAAESGTDLAQTLDRTIHDVEASRRRAAEAQAEARRRFSARRCAMRISDLAAAARFGPERPGTRRSDSPIPL